ncbi:hypothetical protein Gotri_019632, partial [Gossypium trilobum]|nr:hypothetical protein [Gossypium trilobum]
QEDAKKALLGGKIASKKLKKTRKILRKNALKQCQFCRSVWKPTLITMNPFYEPRRGPRNRHLLNWRKKRKRRVWVLRKIPRICRRNQM